jgi:3-oxoacyl-[acyl-carrier protein] reductase
MTEAMAKTLSGITALVTGASRGLGRAIALALAEAGADLLLHTRDSSEIEQVADLVRGHGIEATILRADLQQTDSLFDMIAEIRRLGPSLGILINNVGLRDVLPFEQVGIEALRHLMRINFEAAFFLAQAAIPLMRQRNGGCIINIGGTLIHTGGIHRTHLAASKAALWGMTRALATEFAAENIRVNMISPGYIQPANSPQSLQPAIPMGRVAYPEEVAAMAVALCGQAGAYVTGQTIEINGGTHYS